MATSIACTVLMALGGTAHAANFTVNDVGDQSDVAIDGSCEAPNESCTLRAAAEEAVANDEADVIDFDLPDPSTIDLGTSLPILFGGVDIDGPGAGALTIRRTGEEPFSVLRGADQFRVAGVTVTGGRAVGGFGGAAGGGIAVEDGATLESVVVTGNTAVVEGANGQGLGGGIASAGPLVLRSSTVASNTVQATDTTGSSVVGGGGVAVLCVFSGCGDSAATISDSTISGNSVEGTGTSDEVLGGGLLLVGSNEAPASIVNSTVSGNSASAAAEGSDAVGGGIAALFGQVNLTGVTVAGNSARAGANLLRFRFLLGPVDIGLSFFSLRNTLVAEPGGGAGNCATATFDVGTFGGDITGVEPGLGGSDGFNLADDDSCGLDEPTDQVGVDPQLGPLADNGGPTQTRALAPSSPAVDQGSAAAEGVHPALEDDQRGGPRPVDQPVADLMGGDGADIGAFELQEGEGDAEDCSGFDAAGCWRLGEDPGSTVASDSSGNENDGDYLGGVALGQLGVFPDDTAALLDGVNDLVRVPDDPTLDVGDSFTAEGWIKRSSATKTHALFNKGGGGLHLVVMNAGSGSQVFLRKANGTTIARSAGGVPADGQFHHVAATMNGAGTAQIYIDGAPDTVQVNAIATIADTNLPLFFGSANTTPATYDELALYDRALTAGEIADHAALGFGPI